MLRGPVLGGKTGPLSKFGSYAPSGWEFCGYTSIRNPPNRYQVIDRNRLAELLNLNSVEELTQQQRTWVETAIEDIGGPGRLLRRVAPRNDN